jgi:hypothetical protein
MNSCVEVLSYMDGEYSRIVHHRGTTAALCDVPLTVRGSDYEVLQSMQARHSPISFWRRDAETSGTLHYCVERALEHLWVISGAGSTSE